MTTPKCFKCDEQARWRVSNETEDPGAFAGFLFYCDDHIPGDDVDGAEYLGVEVVT